MPPFLIIAPIRFLPISKTNLIDVTTVPGEEGCGEVGGMIGQWAVRQQQLAGRYRDRRSFFSHLQDNYMPRPQHLAILHTRARRFQCWKPMVNSAPDGVNLVEYEQLAPSTTTVHKGVGFYVAKLIHESNARYIEHPNRWPKRFL